MTEPEFMEALRAKYGGNDFALLPQVRNATGFARRVRTADALAVSLWPSRGIGVIGFEFKDSRTDWLKELKEAAKAEEIGRYCCQWWIVVSDPAIVGKGELPAAWGLMHATGGGVKLITQAPHRESQEPGWNFVAAVLRAAVDVVTPEAEIERRIQKARNETWELANANLEATLAKRMSATEGRYATLAKAVADFEAASGVKLDTWSGSAGNKRIGEAVKFVLAGGLSGLTDELRRVAEVAGRVKQQAEAVTRAPEPPTVELQPGYLPDVGL